jgi:hypothetical protein
MMKLTTTALALLTLAGCSSIIEGTSQEITVNTNPSGASCAFMREGQPIGTVHPTPGAVLVKKTKYDITIVCDRPGFDQATYLNHSGAAGATFGNIVLGGGIGWAIDSTSGADNKYDTPVNLTMVPKAALLAPVAITPAVSTPAPTASPASLPVSDTTPYEQAQQQFRQAEEQYQRQLGLQRAEGCYGE